jgi:hypothetical protein
MLFHPFNANDDPPHILEHFGSHIIEHLTVPKAKPKVTSIPKTFSLPRQKAYGNAASAANMKPYRVTPQTPQLQLTAIRSKATAASAPPKKPEAPNTVAKKQQVDNDVDKVKTDGQPGDVKRQLEQASSPELKNATKTLEDGGAITTEKDIEPLLDRAKTDGVDPSTGKMSFAKTWEFAKNNWKTGLGAAAAIAFVAMTIHAKVQEDKINSTTYTIIKMVSDNDDDSLINIYYEPVDEFSMKDTVIISNTDAEPSKNGSYTLQDAMPGMIAIKTNSILTKDGTTGNIKVYTDFSNQFSKTTEDAIEPVLDTVESLVDAGSKTLFGTVGTVLSNLVPDALKDFTQKFWWVSIIVCLLSLFVSSSAGVGFFVLKK